MTILVAYSADDYGRAAFDQGVEEAGKTGERLIVINVTRGDRLVDQRFAGEVELTGLRERLAELAVDGEVRQAVSPEVAEHILALIQEEAARLVVVGVRKRTAVGKLFLGSVAQRLILEAPCPVLAVKPPA